MASTGFVDVGGSTSSAPVVIGDLCFEMLKEVAKNRHGNCNLYSLLSTLEDLAERLGLTHTVTFSEGKLVYQTTMKLDESSYATVAQLLKRIFEESSCARPEAYHSTEYIKIAYPLPRDPR